MIPRWLFLAAAVAGAPAAVAAQDAPVDAVITGLRPSQHGELIVALYRGPTGWLDLDSAVAVRRLPVAADSVRVGFDPVPVGDDYAIAVLHDRNANDRLDMRWFPIPKPREGAGVSNNHVRMGKPDYDKARFAVTAEGAVVPIRMRY